MSKEPIVDNQKPKEKTIKELGDEIQALNFLLLEQRDSINAISSKRDKYKLIVESFFGEFERQRQLYVRIDNHEKK